ncbi:MAG: hypothetical protein P0Y56_03115 [Candidatus Andeanibacterium colombiense]|uniref:CBU-0592-like domain-containing protein n=1 Tax=Candidatus Andeanibacterium colombiense TaxID=3121345 RepID=A0AAJ6BQ25_9SPHN|nr:MAG: hypothetical protein P0Y56_03115 [Sphingomonadaceae bacterium]
MISPLLADIIGLTGTVLFVGAFAYANAAKELNKLLFNAVNLIGAVLLLTSLSVNFNLAAFVMETAWGIIAFFGLVSALMKRRKTR